MMHGYVKFHSKMSFRVQEMELNAVYHIYLAVRVGFSLPRITTNN